MHPLRATHLRAARHPRLLVLAVAGLLALAVTGCAAPAAQLAGQAGQPAPPPATYYLALGDSLAQGVQPDAAGVSVPTRVGYADQLYGMLRRGQPGLRLVKLGCPGETTGTMIHGGICHYQAGSQLAAAAGFLRAHRGRVSLITLDIGANDPYSCVIQRSVAKLASCVASFIPEAGQNLATILARLRQASPGTRIVAMNYYLPVLAEWRHGWVGEMLARASELAADGYNSLLGRVYRAYRVPVANVFSAFYTPDFGSDVTVPGFGSLPRNVAAICRWTWACTAGPRGPNEHANQAGYQVIARAFLLAGAR
ncbi:MAG TPA: SGNH/GDSL hydrolase family protein [Streptosporangiaceae bacterium]|nr:SGNH/GDSL hydrolase family protein [Streptosporangiaceae bacterium]